VLHDDYSKIFQLPKRYQKWYTKGTALSIMPVGVVQGVTTQGLSYNLQNDTLTLGYRTSSSNSAAQDGMVVIEHQEGDLLLMECHD
jgi:thiamine pyrophosphokinase